MSDPKSTDVSKVAEQLGGGGRRHAAGAIIDSLDQIKKTEPNL